MTDEPELSPQSEAELLPPVLYIPTITGGDSTQHLQMHQLPDGRIALPVYTALDRLAAALGDDQAWVLLTLDALSEARELSPFDVILRDARPVTKSINLS